MLSENYNFNPYSEKSSDSYQHVSGHISECIKWLDEHLSIYLQKNKCEPDNFIGKKIEQFKKSHKSDDKLVNLMKKLVHLRNAFQHGENLIEGQQIYIRYRDDKIKLENELIDNFQKDYHYVHNWLIAQI